MNIPLDIQNLRKSFLNGDVNPRQMCEALLQRAESISNPNIWIYRLSAEELEPYLVNLEASDPGDLPLYGIPFAIKDNIDLAGIVTTAGCEAYSYKPEVSATVVENLIRAGAIPMGKTNLDQFATGLVGVRSPYGIPRNPIAPDRVPGGSSSGSAVALSEGLVSFSLGTDTAGSGRVPAMFNKLWGIKPSKGRLSTCGVVPACRTLDCVSIFALNAQDGELLLDTAGGFDPGDPYSQPAVDVSLPTGNRIGVPKLEQLLFFGDANYETAWEKALEDLELKGWQIETIDFEPFLQAARLLYEGPWVSERTAALKDFLITNADDFFPATRKIIGGGIDNTACEAFAASYKLAELKRASESAWDGLAAIVTPTAGGFPTLADLEADPIGPNSQLGYYTNFMNLLDLCAVATPAGETVEGLPFGITWIGPRDTDKALIQMASGQPQKDSSSTTLSVLLFGAHMRGLPLNDDLQSLGGIFVDEVQTAPVYKMVYLPKPAPHRPGILRVGEGGASISAEEWILPKASLGALLATIQQPLGLGQILLDDGRQVHGFLCEAIAAEASDDISAWGGWRRFLENRSR